MSPSAVADVPAITADDEDVGQEEGEDPDVVTDIGASIISTWAWISGFRCGEKEHDCMRSSSSSTTADSWSDSGVRGDAGAQAEAHTTAAVVCKPRKSPDPLPGTSCRAISELRSAHELAPVRGLITRRFSAPRPPSVKWGVGFVEFVVVVEPVEGVVEGVEGVGRAISMASTAA